MLAAMASPLDSPTLRRAQAKDAPALARLVAATIAFSNAYEYTAQGRARIARLYTAPMLARSIARGRVHVARDAKGLAGLVAVSPGRQALNVDALFVHPDAQGLGLGAALLEHGLEAAWSGGETAPRVTVLSSLTAEGFYARRGFERLREVPRDYGLAILMSRC